ncbi:MAG: type I secretion system permease/ATPase [Aquabacterium sp.]
MSATLLNTTPPSDGPLEARSLPLRQALALVRRQIGVLALFSLSITVLLLVPTLYMMQVYDRVLATRNLTTLAVISLLVLGLYGLLAAIEHVRSGLLVRLGAQVDQTLAPAVFDAAFQQQGREGAHRLTADLVTIRQFLAGNMPNHLMDAPLAIVFVLAATLIDRWLGLAVALSAALLAVLAIVNERRTRSALLEASSLAASAQHQAAESLRHGEAIRAMGMLDALRHRWLQVNQAAQSAHSRAAETGGRIGSALRFVRLATQSLGLAVGAWLVIEHRLSPGMMIATSVLLGRVVAPVEGLVSGWRQMVALRDAWARLDRALPEVAEAALIRLPEAEGAIKVVGAGWQPAQAGEGSRPVLADISFSLQAGEALAIMGGSGAGKSTLAKLLAGALGPTTGEVQMDGAGHHLRDAAARAASIGYLPQEVQLFDGSVAENIARMGTVDERAVVEAAQRAGIHELIVGLPQGYNTRLAPGMLSGGQRQRLGLARAMYGQPRLLVLDEPNAHLDEPGERALLMAIEQHKADGGTVVIVVHRTPALRAMDKVLVLRDGRQVAFGPRDAVLQPRQQPIPMPVDAAIARRA